jgi:peptidyl-tRNA hydrolase, PTH1 family
MGLFVRKHTENADQPLYSTSLGNTILIVGLGNIGEQYNNTRHNIGFDCIDEFARQQGFPAWQKKADLKCHLSKQNIGQTHIILIKPTTFMNESGQAVSAVAKYFKIANSSITVVHDDLDINFGQIKTKVGGGSAGNNGIKSLIQHIGEDFGRVRIGIKNDLLEKTDSADFVLAKFNKEEMSEMPKLKREVSAILSEYTVSGVLPPSTSNFLL